MNRFREASRHLRSRLQQSAGVRCDAIVRGGTFLFRDVVVVPLNQRNAVKQENETPSSAKSFVWLISLAAVSIELKEGDELHIEGEKYRISKDEQTEQVWRYHGESKQSRAYFSVLWGR